MVLNIKNYYPTNECKNPKKKEDYMELKLSVHPIKYNNFNNICIVFMFS